MKITLYLKDKIIVFKLPKEISGSFSFDVDKEEESKLINVEARENGWVLYETKDVKVFADNTFVKEVPLISNHFYILQRDQKNYLIHASELGKSSFVPYRYQKDLNLTIGFKDAALSFACPYLNFSLKISYKNGRLTLEKPENALVYINKHSIFASSYFLSNGDELEIFGLRLIFLTNLVLIESRCDVTLNSEMAHLQKDKFPPLEKSENLEVKDVDLYNPDDYFSKSPRIRRLIETKKIKLSNPPRDADANQLPLILVIGPMFTMGMVSFIMLLNTVIRITNKETTLADSWPQLVISGSMMISMLLWPLKTQLYNKRMRKKKQQETIEKYTAYLEEKKDELRQEKNLQREILMENLIPVSECLQIIKSRGVNFWDKRMDQSDFLTARLGVGNELLDVEIEYPDEDFTIEENELRKKADALVAEFKYIENVPIGYSFYENKATAIMGITHKIHYFLENILLQLMTFYSYEDLKIVLFTKEENQDQWAYLRYLNHTFSNAKDFRFFASNQEDAKIVTEYLNNEFNQRINLVGKVNSFAPYYLIVVEDYDMIKHYDLIKNITETDDNVGFSVIFLENHLNKLPSKCNNFITINETNSGIMKNSYEKQETLSFVDEINYNINMMQVVKILSNIPIEFSEGVHNLPDSISFLEMEKVGKVEQLNILNRWNSNDSTTSLKAEVGVDQEGELMYLDLHEKYHGPHGLIAGMTGSGKSEFIITYILSMAINYSPDDVAFILIDYKGGGLAFAFENKTTGVILPHLAGTITNLDKAEMNRTLVSIDSEIKRRQQLFNSARDALGESTMDIYKYQRFFKEGRLEAPVPHLFIICDEFAELKTQQPDFMDNLISVARIGRSLGVHLILATQKPSGVVNDQIWSNTKFRVCLKVQDESDSKEMLKRNDAAMLKQVGRFYLQVGYDEYFALGQSAWCGAKYYPSEKIVKQVDKSVNFINDYGNFIKSIQANNGIKIQAQGEQLAAILNSVIEIAKKGNKKARKLWLDNIPSIILATDLEKKYQIEYTSSIKALIGEYDAPEKQAQGLVEYSLIEDGNALVYGNDGTEREMFLTIFLYTLTKNYSSSQVQFYMIDYGSESLRRFLALPHVGGMVFSGEEEKYNNLLKMLREEIESRKKLFVDYGGEYRQYMKTGQESLPLKVVILNNYDSIYENIPTLYEELPDLIRDSERYGIIFVITANAINSVHSKISSNCHKVFAYKLKDFGDYMAIFGKKPRSAPPEKLGRGLVETDGIHEFQTAQIIKETETLSLNDYLMDFIKEQRQKNTIKAKRIPTLPEHIQLQDVQEEIDNMHSVPVGISKKDLELLEMDFLANIGNIISSNKLVNTENFVRSLLTVFSKTPNTLVVCFDPFQKLMLSQDEYPNYYNDHLEEVLDKMTEYINNLIAINQTFEGAIIIYGFQRFITKLSDKKKLESFIKALKDYEKISLIIVEEASKIKQFVFEPWFNGTFSVNDGIWIGKGMADQSLFHLTTVTREMMQELKNDMGYFISESSATLCKWIDFVTKDEEEKDEE